jgi:hypothetical protein
MKIKIYPQRESLRKITDTMVIEIQALLGDLLEINTWQRRKNSVIVLKKAGHLLSIRCDGNRYHVRLDDQLIDTYDVGDDIYKDIEQTFNFVFSTENCTEQNVRE